LTFIVSKRDLGKNNKGVKMNELKSLSDFGNVTFEDLANENGGKFWWASDLMKILDYPNMKSFSTVISRAIKAMMNLEIDHFENIQQCLNNGESDYKLSRFSCYMIAMNADPKKNAVALAQLYFVEMTRKFELLFQKSDEIKDMNFTDKGYLGLYNMYNWQLAQKRGIDKSKLLEYMGRTELAANLFRLVMTEERIKSMKIEGQENLEKAHYDVGREIRRQVKENVGKNPEDLPKARQLPEVRKEIKHGYHKMLKEDKTEDK
jgi:DNA-damage-inducible protein D